MPETSTTLRVRYVETDQMGVVHHSAYLAWMEVARTEYLRVRGVPYRTLEDGGIRMPVLGLSLRYRQPARYDDEILIKARLIQANGVRFTFEYDILRAPEETLLASGRTEHASTDLNGKPRRLPSNLLSKIGDGCEKR
jgi:acyl-CoA thioester hydrolase